MTKSCHFCLESKTDLYKILDLAIEDAMRVVFPIKGTDSFNNTIICTECLHSLHSVHKFIIDANESNHRKNSVSVELDCTIVIENYNICQTCLRPMSGGGINLFDHFENTVPHYEIQKMLAYCSLNLDIDAYQCPAICDICWEKLKKSYSFVKKYAENDQEPPDRLTELANLNNSQEDTIPDIKIEFEECIIKDEEPDEYDLFDNMWDEIGKSNEGYNVNIEQPEKKLYVELTRYNFKEMIHQKLKKRKKTPSSIHKCRKCRYTTGTKRNYSKHMKTHMTLKECTDRDTLFECHTCLYCTKNKYSLARHFKEVHYKHNKAAVVLNCRFCPFTSYSERRMFQHSSLHNLENVILKCAHCDFETDQIWTLEQHRAYHLTMRMKKLYKCKFCDFKVRKKSTIDRHVLTHLSRRQLRGKLHPCGHCKYKCKRKDALVAHVRHMHKTC